MKRHLKKYTYSSVNFLLCHILENLGTSKQTAFSVATQLLENEIGGYPSHGVRRILQYVIDAKNKILDVNAEPYLKKTAPNIAHLEGNFSFGVKVIESIVQYFQENAQHHAFTAICVNHAHHLGRLYPLGARLAKAPNNLILMGFCNYLGAGARVAPPHQESEACLSTNPMVLAFPVKNSAPFVLDMSTSTVSEGSIAQAFEWNHELPEGILVDKNEQSITAPQNLYTTPPIATMTSLGHPLSAHKGYGLAVFIEALVGILAGANNVIRPANGGNGLFLFTVNPQFFNTNNNNFSALSTELLHYCYAAKRYPGFSTHQMATNKLPKYIPLSEDLYNQLLELN